MNNKNYISFVFSFIIIASVFFSEDLSNIRISKQIILWKHGRFLTRVKRFSIGVKKKTFVKPKSEVQSPKVKNKRTWADPLDSSSQKN